jgi:hypothetical protein
MSTASADVWASETYGERRLFWRRDARSPEAASGEPTAVAAIATVQSAILKRTASNRRR